jgi:hypothetical protein
MSRLLFAAARGARIQTNDRGGWLDAAYIPTADYKGDDFRIHPDDEHLQYGPISTALRDASENVQPRMMYTISNFILVGAVCDYTEVVERNDGWNSALNIHRSLFLLFLAEALADSGL